MPILSPGKKLTGEKTDRYTGNSGLSGKSRDPSPGGGGGGGGTLIFSACVGSDPASTVHPKKISGISSIPKKIFGIQC